MIDNTTKWRKKKSLASVSDNEVVIESQFKCPYFYIRLSQNIFRHVCTHISLCFLSEKCNGS